MSQRPCSTTRNAATGLRVGSMGTSGPSSRSGARWWRSNDFDFDEARDRVDALARHAPTREHWPVLAGVQVLIDLGSGKAVAGLVRLLNARTRRKGRSPVSLAVRPVLDAVEVRVRLATGDLRGAANLAARIPKAFLNERALAGTLALLAHGRGTEALTVLYSRESDRS